jgi:predicted porin
MRVKQPLQLSSIAVLLAAVSLVPITANAADPVEFKWSGQISRALSFADNGVDDDVLFVDNNNSGTRLRLTGKTGFGNGLEAGIHWETQFQENSSSAIDIGDLDASNNDGFTSRKRDLWFSGAFGKVSLGQGDGAANGTSEVDFSGTTIADYSGNNLDDGISFVGANGLKGTEDDPADVSVKNGSVFSNFDGLSRNDRIRYDTPKLGPVGLAISAGQERGEIGVRYSTKFGDGGKFGAAIGIVDRDRDNNSGFGQTGLSASLLLGSGFNVGVHYGERDFDSRGVDAEGTYIKVGQKFGSHNVSIAFHQVDDLNQVGDEAERVNLSWVYVPKKGIELFVSLNSEELSRTSGDLEDQDIFALGSRIKF